MKLQNGPCELPEALTPYEYPTNALRISYEQGAISVGDFGVTTDLAGPWILARGVPAPWPLSCCCCGGGSYPPWHQFGEQLQEGNNECKMMALRLQNFFLRNSYEFPTNLQGFH